MIRIFSNWNSFSLSLSVDLAVLGEVLITRFRFTRMHVYIQIRVVKMSCNTLRRWTANSKRTGLFWNQSYIWCQQRRGHTFKKYNSSHIELMITSIGCFSKHPNFKHSNIRKQQWCRAKTTMAISLWSKARWMMINEIQLRVVSVKSLIN